MVSRRTRFIIKLRVYGKEVLSSTWDAVIDVLSNFFPGFVMCRKQNGALVAARRWAVPADRRAVHIMARKSPVHKVCTEKVLSGGFVNLLRGRL